MRRYQTSPHFDNTGLFSCGAAAGQEGTSAGTAADSGRALLQLCSANIDGGTGEERIVLKSAVSFV